MVAREPSVKSMANIGRKLRESEQTETEANEEESRRTSIIIGIDYGTSFSGAAYTLYKRRPREPSVTTVSDWPHAHPHHRSSQKVPSDIAYDLDGQVYCGFDIPDHCKRLKWVKLLLETDPVPKKATLLQADEVKSTREFLIKLGKSPVEAVSDYLKWFWDTICETVADEQNDTELLATSDVTVMMTVPAMWSDAAKENTFRAAEKAGISANGRVVKFITEPEAAAIAELQLRISNGQINKGDCVIICDAGGGTVDLVSYQVRSEEPMELDQAAVADGGLCGSSYVDEAFLRQIQMLLQSDWHKLSMSARDDVKERFAYSIKPAFDGKSTARRETIHLSSDNGQLDHVQNGKLIIDPEYVRNAFESVVPQILALIAEQERILAVKGLTDKLRGVLLVGGLGSSRYVQNRVEQNFTHDQKIKVWRGRHSWSSVVEGAVKCAFMSLGNIQTVTLRLSKYNYGIPFHPPFDPSIHRSEDMFNCPYEGSPKARLVQWLIRKGQEIKSDDEPQIQDFTKIIRTSDTDYNFCETGFALLQSNEDSAPEYSTDAVKNFVKVDCRFHRDLLQGSWHRQYGHSNQNGSTYWKAVVQLQVHMLPAQVQFQCLLSGQSMVSTKVSYRSNESPQTVTSLRSHEIRPVHDRQRSSRSKSVLMSNEPVNMRTETTVPRTQRVSSYMSEVSGQYSSTYDRNISHSPQLPELDATTSFSVENSTQNDARLVPQPLKLEKEKKRHFWKKEHKVMGEDSPSVSEIPGQVPGFYGRSTPSSVRSKESWKGRFHIQ